MRGSKGQDYLSCSLVRETRKNLQVLLVDEDASARKPQMDLTKNALLTEHLLSPTQSHLDPDKG
jgi:hypothetical protein